MSKVVTHDPDGSPVTAGEMICRKIRLGLEQHAACNAAGIDRSSLHRWRLAGARLNAQAIAGRLPKPGPKQRALMNFCHDLEKAETDAEAMRLEVIHGAATGGGVVTKTTVKTAIDPEGNERVVERTEVRETLAPVWTAAAWFLERRMPARYARRVEVTGADGTPLLPPDEQARNIADSLRDFLAGAAAGADVNGTNGAHR